MGGKYRVREKLWNVIYEVAELVYLTEPHERLSTIAEAMPVYFSSLKTSVRRQLENTILRLVIYMEVISDDKIDY